MPSNPTVRDVNISKPLTNMSVAFSQDPANFFAMRVFPPLPVTQKSGEFYVWDRGDWNRDDAQAVGAGDEYPIGVKRLSSNPYNCKVYKYSEMIADEERANQDTALDLDMTATENVTRKHMIRLDRDFAASFFVPGVWTGSTTGTDITPAAKWDDTASGDPLADLRPEIRKLMARGLRRANIKLLVGPDVWDAIQDHPVFLERYENVMEANLTTGLIARTLGIGEVIVAESVYNAAAEGQAPDDQFILGADNALLVYAAPRPALNVPSGGYTMRWTGLTGGQGINVRKIRRGERDADQILSRSAFDNNLVASECGVLFTDVLT